MQIRTLFARCRRCLRAARLFPSPRQRGDSLIFPSPAVARSMSAQDVARSTAETGCPRTVQLRSTRPHPSRPRAPACWGPGGRATARKEMSGIEFYSSPLQPPIAGRGDSIEKA